VKGLRVGLLAADGLRTDWVIERERVFGNGRVQRRHALITVRNRSNLPGKSIVADVDDKPADLKRERL